MNAARGKEVLHTKKEKLARGGTIEYILYLEGL